MQSMLRKSFAICVFTVASALSGAALATTFQISSAVLATPGGGYGTDVNESSGTLLGVSFTSTFTPQTFTLANAGDFHDFRFSSVNFFEPNSNGGITSAETDGLGLQATFMFTLPGAGPQQLTTTGVATIGSVNDAAVDFNIDWTPVTVPFGTSGQYQLELFDVSFTKLSGNNPTAMDGRVTLLTADKDEGTVPEPGSLALAGLGLMAGAVVRRRKR